MRGRELTGTHHDIFNAPPTGHPTHAQQAFNVSMPMNVKAEAAELPALEFSSWDEKRTSSSGTRVAAPRGGARAGAGATFQPTRAGAGSGAAAKLGAAASSSLAAFTPTPASTRAWLLGSGLA